MEQDPGHAWNAYLNSKKFTMRESLNHKRSREGYLTEQTRKVFMRRTASIYGGMLKRWPSGILPFTLSIFRDWVEARMDSDGTMICYLSGQHMLVDDFSVDHKDPVARGGSFDLMNLCVCTKAENLRKGELNYMEYSLLREFVEKQIPLAASLIWRRLEVGDVQRGAWWRRENKKRKEAIVRVVKHAR